MRVISHRGLWTHRDERNTLPAFRRSAELGFGTETDVRDAAGALVISHDPPAGGEPTFEEFLEVFAGHDVPLAINVKADGLAPDVAAALRAADIRDPFVFDMAVPDARAYLGAGVPVFSRLSDVEPVAAYADRVQGVWLDAFDSDDWWTAATVDEVLDAGLRLCFVSPDLHGRDPEPVWERLRPWADADRVLLCTDRPEDAVTAIGASA